MVKFNIGNIPEFFSDRSVLITGATGFIGKGIVEKLLRSCPNIKTIYTLVRTKKGQESQNRIKMTLESEIFDVVRKTAPDQLEKVIAVPGEITLPLLGLSDFDLTTIVSQVSVIIHAAATIKFNEHLKIASTVNIEATQEVIKIAKMIPNFASMVHVSTVFSNCDRSEVEEKIYEMNLNPYKHLETMKVLDEEQIEFLTPKLLGSLPNTYTLTKALAEQIVKEESKEIPISIVRPSIVMGTWNEPFSGFVDNMAGPNGIIASYLSGKLKVLHADECIVIDKIPLDKIVNLIIVAAWKTAISHDGNLRIYHGCSSHQNPNTLKSFLLFLREFEQRFEFKKISNRYLWFFSNWFLYTIVNFFTEYLPCWILDAFSVIRGETPMMMKMYIKGKSAKDVLDKFLNTDFFFHSSKAKGLYDSLDPCDKAMFNFDISDVDWRNFIINACYGIQKHLLKDQSMLIPPIPQHLLNTPCEPLNRHSFKHVNGPIKSNN